MDPNLSCPIIARTIAHAELGGSLPVGPSGLSMRPTQPERTTCRPQKARGLIEVEEEEEEEEGELRRKASTEEASDAAPASPLPPPLLLPAFSYRSPSRTASPPPGRRVAVRRLGAERQAEAAAMHAPGPNRFWARGGDKREQQASDSSQLHLRFFVPSRMPLPTVVLLRGPLSPPSHF
jgi:hypothetical protein